MTALNAAEFKDDCRRIRDWLFTKAFPLWADVGVDRTHGGFHERLMLGGAPDLHCSRRLRVTARQIYAFCEADNLGWDGPGADIALQGYEFLTHRGWGEDGGFIHLWSPQGVVVDDRRDTYDHAFVLLAFASLYRATGRHDPITWAERTIDFLDTELSDAAHGGYLESLPPTTPRRQNPHMHLLEAMLALHAATGEEAYLGRAHDLVDLFRKHFFQAADGRLQEMFGEDWTPLNGDAAEPGHHYEWVWLLYKYGVATGELVGEYMDRLYDFAEERGLNADGFAVDAVAADGAPLKPSRRCWPQTEALKAHLAMAEAGRRDTSVRLRQTLDSLFDPYLNLQPEGAWMDSFDENGAPSATHIPASTLYHIVCAFSETLRVLESD